MAIYCSKNSDVEFGIVPKCVFSLFWNNILFNGSNKLLWYVCDRNNMSVFLWFCILIIYYFILPHTIKQFLWQRALATFLYSLQGLFSAMRWRRGSDSSALPCRIAAAPYHIFHLPGRGFIHPIFFVVNIFWFFNRVKSLIYQTYVCFKGQRQSYSG